MVHFFPKPSTFLRLTYRSPSLPAEKGGYCPLPLLVVAQHHLLLPQQGGLSTIGSFNPFLPEHFLSTRFLGSLKLFHFHVFDLAFLCRSIKSQKKPSKPPKPPFLQALAPKEVVKKPPISLQQLFFFSISGGSKAQIFGCYYKILPVILSPIQTHFTVTQMT